MYRRVGRLVRLVFAFGSKDVGDEAEGRDEDKPEQDGVAGVGVKLVFFW